MQPVCQKVLRDLAPLVTKPVSISASWALSLKSASIIIQYNKDFFIKELPTCTLPNGNTPLSPTTKVVD